MATIHGKLAFGVRIKVKSLLVPDKSMMDMFLKVVENKVTSVLSTALSTIQLVPGLEISISEAKSQIEIEKVDP